MTTEISPTAINAATLRDVLGHFATGVVVVTGMEGGAPVGFTCQSFTSLSFDPPLITFSPSRTSVTWPRIRAGGRFCVNVLGADHAHHSNAFARSGGDKFAGVVWAPTAMGNPVLDGITAWIDCTLHAEHDGGDHTIVVGRITDLGADPQRPPLLYHRGRYLLSGEPTG